MHRSFRPSDFRWRDLPLLICWLVVLSLITSGFSALLNGNLEGLWPLAIGLISFVLIFAGIVLYDSSRMRAGYRKSALTNPSDHERFMRRCVLLAGMAGEDGNTPVGSVVVLGEKIIGEGTETLPNESSITGHAEILACQAALDATGRRDLVGAILYTTAEPCFMCSYAIRQLRISLVVYGIDTPVIGGITSNHPILTDPALDTWREAPAVIGGVMREECVRLKAR